MERHLPRIDEVVPRLHTQLRVLCRQLESPPHPYTRCVTVAAKECAARARCQLDEVHGVWDAIPPRWRRVMPVSLALWQGSKPG